MKQILQILPLILLLTQTTLADTLTVKQDSTGDYTIIQDAMNAANTGDTVLVWPGTYYENLDFNGKSITLASLSLTTGDESYKYSTVIDGNQNGSCISIHSNEQNAVVHGLTLTNGHAVKGGGIQVFGASASIISCIITENFAFEWCGGIYCGFDGVLFLSGNSIYNNYTYGQGGGMGLGLATAVFDSINRNSIFSNYASLGCDFHKANDEPLVLFLDTCTVLFPDTYFISSINNNGYQKDDIEVSVQNAILTPVDTDLYVNPLTGSNDNSGLSWDQPLKTIAFAYSKIAVDSLEKNTIHIANGLYSDTTNYEKFPLNIRPFVNVIGQSRAGVVLDGNRNIFILKGNNNITDYSIQRMTLQGGPIPTYESFDRNKMLAELYTGNDRFVLDSIVFRDSYALPAYGILHYYQADSSMVKNCEFYGNKGGHNIRTAANDKTYTLSNLIVHNNMPDYDEPDYPMGVAFSTGGNGRGVIQNSLFYENEASTVTAWTYPNLYLVNCTFTGNSIVEPWGSIGVIDANMHLYNCISYNEGTVPLGISMNEPQKEIVSHLNIYNSLIEGGEASINIGSQCNGDTWCRVHYDETNIDEDPLFLGKWEHPYQIADGSPCIDAGTLARLPDFIELPEFDLAGNPRIVGDSIDMGAYEWNPTVGVDEYLPVFKKEKPKLLRAYPNPFSTSTTISAQWDSIGHVQIEIYNNAGLRVKVLKSGSSGGKSSIQTRWDGKGQNGNLLPAGIYHVVMFWDGKEVEGMKVVKR